ncbi:hypothetical protein [Mitsuaria sp. GD03876]|uniref:hypothetical protein n=1 Tax=Mitsuaria sp. GD03876 TaxID=2975399 RepID=UPI00244C0BB3|nr:hypothetical protein [Mitsuaria sp. GD03876]MDH0867864.1 hypothetical protein [Mitsuaria sp. GD03876]
MKHAMHALLTAGLLLGAAGAKAETYDAVSPARAIKEINFQMTPQRDGGAVYFVADGGWQATGCPNARYAYVPESWSGAKIATAIALSAKSSGRMVRVSGMCGDSAGDTTYMRVYYITME